MTGRTHLTFGITTAALFSTFALSPESRFFIHPALFTGLAALGSLMPDLDHKESIMSHKLPHLSYVIRRLSGCQKEQFDVSRTYMHDVVLWTVLSIFITINVPWMFGFFFGYLGHLFLDGMTIKGDSFLYFFHRHEYGLKFKNGRFHLLPENLRVGSNAISAKILTGILICVFGFLMIRFGNGLFHYSDFVNLL